MEETKKKINIIPVLLDTSTFISLSKDKLEKYNSENFKIMISPYTFFELLCHLDDHLEEDWKKSKGNICKCSSVEILDDPHAIIETELHYQTERLKDSLPDSQLIPEILKCLRNSNSINDFYKSDFIDKKGQKRLICGCSKMARKILDEEKTRYLNYIKEIRQCIKQQNYDINSEKDSNEIIKQFIGARVIDAKNNFNQTKDISNQVFNLCYLYYSYIFERTKQLIINGKEEPDRNDYVDSCICLHLHLDKPFTFVTNDNGIYKATKNSIERLKKLGKNTGRDRNIYWGWIGINL